MSDTETRACPECDAAAVAPRRSSNIHDPEERSEQMDSKYRCDQCGAFFDEPVERAYHEGSHGKGGSALTARLLDADSEVFDNE